MLLQERGILRIERILTIENVHGAFGMVERRGPHQVRVRIESNYDGF